MSAARAERKRDRSYDRLRGGTRSLSADGRRPPALELKVRDWARRVNEAKGKADRTPER
jgi:hypothetical protein